MKKLFALLLVGGLMAVGCGPAPSTKPTTPPMPTTVEPTGTASKTSVVPDDKMKGADDKGAKGGDGK